VTVKLPTTVPTSIVKMESSLGPSSHHLILYRSGETVEQKTPFSCAPFGGALDGTLPLYIAQTANTVLEFPKTPRRVAVKLAAGQMVRIEMHYINYGTAPVTAQGSVKLTTIDELQVDDYADLLFWGNAKIDIPANSAATVGPTWHAPPPGTTILSLTAHTHKHGVGFTVERAEKDMPGTMIYQTNQWDNAPYLQFDPPLALGPTEGLRWTCQYQNDTSLPIRFGESANDEMCFVWGYYYPSRGFQGWIDSP
jgi:hypothetical protein